MVNYSCENLGFFQTLKNWGGERDGTGHRKTQNPQNQKELLSFTLSIQLHLKRRCIKSLELIVSGHTNKSI